MPKFAERKQSDRDVYRYFFSQPNESEKRIESDDSGGGIGADPDDIVLHSASKANVAFDLDVMEPRAIEVVPGGSGVVAHEIPSEKVVGLFPIFSR